MVANLDRSLYWTIVVCAIAAGLLLFSVGNFKKNKWLVIASLVVPLLAWGLYYVARNRAIAAAKPYYQPIELDYFNQKEGCILLVQDNFTYTITHQNKIIEEGKWDIYNKRTRRLLLDGKIFGVDEYAVRERDQSKR